MMRDTPFQQTRSLSKLQTCGWFSNKAEKVRKFTGPLPSMDVLKLARLSKQFHKKILEIFYPMPLTSIVKFNQTLDFIAELNA